MSGGVVALVVSKLIGPRRGRFKYPGLQLPEYGTIFQSLGAIFLWIGFYGIVITSVNSMSGAVASRAMQALTVSACTGCITTMCLGFLLNGFLSPSLCNAGALCGLVAMSAGCSTCRIEGALVTGELSHRDAFQCIRFF
jgi:ammonium transporter, Amt family